MIEPCRLALSSVHLAKGVEHTVSRISDFLARNNITKLLAEMALIVVGVLLAFQVDRWYEGQQQASQVRDYLTRLINNVEEDLEMLALQQRRFSQRLEYTEFLAATLSNPALVESEPRKFLVALQRSGWRTNFFANNYTFEELRSTGDLAKLPLNIREHLHRYYHTNEHSNQFMPTAVGNQLEYYRRFAGLLEMNQLMLRNPEDDAIYALHDPRDVSVTEARRVYERFRARPEAIEWLPWLKNINLQSGFTNTRYQRLATELLAALNRALEAA